MFLVTKSYSRMVKIFLISISSCITAGHVSSYHFGKNWQERDHHAATSKYTERISEKNVDDEEEYEDGDGGDDDDDDDANGNGGGGISERVYSWWCRVGYVQRTSTSILIT
jgi:hypothetical protein